MNYKTITMPAEANFLSDFMPELPIGIFNKKITATGATTLVMENLQDVIILSPTKALIENKLKQYPLDRCNYEFFVLNGDVETEEVVKYINQCQGKQPVKILSTYDSLYKATCLPGVFSNYHLVIDEFHELLRLTGDREKKAIFVLTEFSKFTKYTFLSATPIKEDFLPYPLNTLDYTELIISDIHRCKVVPLQTYSPFRVIVDIIKNFKINGEFIYNGKSSKHLYIYINTVANIASIIKSAGLTQNDVNIFCGNYILNERKLLAVGCEIGDLLTEKELGDTPEFEAPIHFITSKGFQGCDIYSEDGIAIYVTNCHIKSTVSGMETVQQISGRIRTKINPFNGIIFHIYNVNKSSLTFEEYLADQQDKINDSLVIIKEWDNVAQQFKDSVIRDLETAKILDYTFYHYLDGNGKMQLNDLKIKTDQYTHKVENLIYTKGVEIRKAYIEQGFEVMSTEYIFAESALNNAIKHHDFKGYCTAYNESLKATFYIGEPLFGCPEKTQKLIISAFKKLGYSKIADMKFHQTNIKKHLKVALSFNPYGEITAVNKVFKIGGRYPKPEIKKALKSIYSKLDIKKTATAIRIREYFEADECLLENGNKGLILSKKVNTVFKKKDPETRIGIMNERAA